MDDLFLFSPAEMPHCATKSLAMVHVLALAHFDCTPWFIIITHSTQDNKLTPIDPHDKHHPHHDINDMLMMCTRVLYQLVVKDYLWAE